MPKIVYTLNAAILFEKNVFQIIFSCVESYVRIFLKIFIVKLKNINKNKRIV